MAATVNPELAVRSVPILIATAAFINITSKQADNVNILIKLISNDDRNFNSDKHLETVFKPLFFIYVFAVFTTMTVLLASRLDYIGTAISGFIAIVGLVLFIKENTLKNGEKNEQ